VLEGLVRDIVVGNISVLEITALACATRDGFIARLVRVLFRVFGDDVPCMDEAGDVSQETEGNVDDRVGCADARLDPYY
jgi:hypothetical protein